jgi:hypothetical protein
MYSLEFCFCKEGNEAHISKREAILHRKQASAGT